MPDDAIRTLEALSNTMDSKVKDTNPKDSIGVTKMSMSVLPMQVIGEVSIALLEGALKYGRHNYRPMGVRTTVYVDATFRHLMAFMEGENIDPDSGLCHVTKAIASLVVLRDSMLTGNCVDDRAPKVGNSEWMKELNAKVKMLLDLYPEEVRVPPYVESGGIYED